MSQTKSYTKLAQVYTRARIHDAELKAHGRISGQEFEDLVETMEQDLRAMDYERADTLIDRVAHECAALRYGHDSAECGICVGRYLAAQGLMYQEDSLTELVGLADQ